MNYQFIMEFLFKVMKKTWLLPPDRTEAKNTCKTEERVSLYSHKGENCYNLHSVFVCYQLELLY